MLCFKYILFYALNYSSIYISEHVVTYKSIKDQLK